jgi:hypothetical protein
MRKIVALAALCLAQGAFAADGAWRIGTGVHYSSGDYGGSIETTILAVPLELRYESGPWILKLTVPYLEISGATTVLPGVGPVERNVRSANASGIGDSTVSATYAAYYDPVSRGGFDLTGKVKLATGDENAGLGTGSTDASVQIDGYRAFDGFTLYGSFGYTIFGDSPIVDLDNVFYGNLGVSRRLDESDSAGFEVYLRQAGSPSPLAQRELMGFYNRRFDRTWRGQAYLFKGFSDGSPDWGAGASIAYSF